MIKDNYRKYNGDSVRALLESTSIADKVVRDAGAPAMTGMGMFLREQLTAIIPEILKQEFPAKPALQVLEVDNTGTWDKQIITRLRTLEGRHTPTHAGGNKNSQITVGTKMNNMLVVDYEGSSEYSYKSLMKAKQLGENIDSDIIEAHNESYNSIADEVAWLGIADLNNNIYTQGVANSDLVPASNKLTAGFDWLAPATSGNDIVEDLLSLRNTIYGVGGGNDLWLPNTIICSPQIFITLSGKNFSVTGFSTSETVMSYCQKQYGMKFYASNQLKGLAANGKDRLIAFNNDRRAIVYHIPDPLRFYPLETYGASFVLLSTFAIAGVNLRQATTVGYLDLV